MTDLPGLTYVGHATVRVEVAGRSILTDPVLGRTVQGVLTRQAPLPAVGVADGVDLVLISHLHHDHCDLPSLRRVGREVPILVPAGGGKWLAGKGFSSVHELGLGDAYVDGDLVVRSVPAVHSGGRRGGPQAEAIGYVIAGGGTTTYFAGDTDLYEGMGYLEPSLDVALLPVWGWGPNIGPGHLDPRRAAQVVALMNPRVAVPIHWGTFFPAGLRRFYPKGFSSKGVEFEAHVRRLELPNVVVAVTAPGQVVKPSG